MTKKVLTICGLLVLVLIMPKAIFASEATGTIDTGIETGVDGTLMVTPTASPVADTYTSAKSVTLTSSGSSAICYTTNGTNPVCAASGSSCTTGTAYSSAISVGSTQTIKARSCYPNSNSSSVGSHLYTINIPTPSPGGGGIYVTPTTTKPTTTTTTKPVSVSACQWCGLACMKIQSWMYCPALTPAAGYICTEINGVCTKTIGTTTTTIPTGGSTIASMQARIAELQAMINNLLKQLGLVGTTTTTVPGTPTIPSVTVTGIPAGFTFQNNLREGMVSEDIRYLQRFLNTDPDTKVADSGLGAPGYETNYFGALTKAAVTKFQNKYASEVLTPVGLILGTGYAGPSTRAKLNTLLGE